LTRLCKVPSSLTLMTPLQTLSTLRFHLKAVIAKWFAHLLHTNKHFFSHEVAQLYCLAQQIATNEFVWIELYPGTSKFWNLSSKRLIKAVQDNNQHLL
jgi:hypothetical protein